MEYFNGENEKSTTQIFELRSLLTKKKKKKKKHERM